MIYSRDTPFWSETLEFCSSVHLLLLLLFVIGFVVVVVLVITVVAVVCCLILPPPSPPHSFLLLHLLLLPFPVISSFLVRLPCLSVQTRSGYLLVFLCSAENSVPEAGRASLVIWLVAPQSSSGDTARNLVGGTAVVKWRHR